MITPVKTVNIIKNFFGDTFQIVQKFETIDAFWGIDHIKVTDNDIKALKEGKFLYCNNGEYAQIISYEPQESDEGGMRNENISTFPEDVTNGDMVKALFPNDSRDFLIVNMDRDNWWNAPYKAESEE